jgi:hypothetical protein
MKSEHNLVKKSLGFFLAGKSQELLNTKVLSASISSEKILVDGFFLGR